ncbi:MAG: hypothetical protein J6Q68_05285 [Clostridia bacterium]|nr:hypothetical protein [Clostridia bacterium]
MNLPRSIKLGGMNTGHIQGIAVDRERKYMYYSFTTSFIKTDLDGNIVGSVINLVGHLGCIAYNYDDGKVYASLEYKSDVIGMGVRNIVKNNSGEDFAVEDGFFIAIFDVEKINGMNMDAEKDGIMKTVFLPEVIKDYTAEGHRYGCSGIDGITFAPAPAETNGKKYLYVAYGIYDDVERDDNDWQVILRYDFRDFDKYAASINQKNTHKNGPDSPLDKYFVYTGNTRWGVQNLEYDEDTKLMLIAVYQGHKPAFPNYPMFAVDMSAPCEKSGDRTVLRLASTTACDEKTGIYGIEFPYGSTGMISLGNGYFYFSRPFQTEEGFNTDVGLYKFDGKGSFTEI